MQRKIPQVETFAELGVVTNTNTYPHHITSVSRHLPRHSSISLPSLLSPPSFPLFVRADTYLCIRSPDKMLLSHILWFTVCTVRHQALNLQHRCTARAVSVAARTEHAGSPPVSIRGRNLARHPPPLTPNDSPCPLKCFRAGDRKWTQPNSSHESRRAPPFPAKPRPSRQATFSDPCTRSKMRLLFHTLRTEKGGPQTFFFVCPSIQDWRTWWSRYRGP